jgi:Arc/MetJ-type ribon-helix-helix transcriptional regulator
MAEQGRSGVPDSGKRSSSHTVRLGCDAVSAVKLPQQLTAEIDAWAEAHDATRSDAIRRLIEIGLDTARVKARSKRIRRASLSIEEQAIYQIHRLLDPSLSAGERERRIRRLVEGPAEFSDCRIDQPKHGG